MFTLCKAFLNINSIRFYLEGVIEVDPRGFSNTLTDSEEHRAGALAAAGACPAVAEDSSLLGHQVVLQGLDQKVLALRVVAHQQLGVHVAHQEVSPQQRQTDTLHQLMGGGG